MSKSSYGSDVVLQIFTASKRAFTSRKRKVRDFSFSARRKKFFSMTLIYCTLIDCLKGFPSPFNNSSDLRTIHPSEFYPSASDKSKSITVPPEYWYWLENFIKEDKSRPNRKSTKIRKMPPIHTKIGDAADWDDLEDYENQQWFQVHMSFLLFNIYLIRLS